MLMPNVKNEFPNTVNGIKFTIMAYRQLTKEEMMFDIGYFFRTQKPNKKVKSVVILSVAQ